MLDTRLGAVLSTTSKHLSRLESIGVKTVDDLLKYFPRAYTDNSNYVNIIDMKIDETNTVLGKIKSLVTIRTRTGKKLTKGIFEDETGSIEVMWFNQPHLQRMLPRNCEIVLSGKLKLSAGKLLFQSPSHEILDKYKEQVHTGRIVPVYPETEGISSKWLREKIKPLINEWIRSYEEYMPKEIIKEEGLVSLRTAIKNIHFPESDASLKRARQRLAFDELFLLQLKVLLKKKKWQKIAGDGKKQMTTQKDVIKYFIDNLPFKLTKAQDKSTAEILADFERTFPMHRLLQGDVGSGKTIVAAIAALNVIKNGYQVVIMAPTEILAKQHYQSFLAFLREHNVNIQFIAGSTTDKQKREIITQMKTGTCDIVIGTHALIQDKIGFKKLGLAIIDEQHRFGVQQRAKLKEIGDSPHLLSLSATPIPRTLAITVYGDQDLSIIDEMPAGRQEIITRTVPEEKRQDAYRWIEAQVQKGRQAFVICPLIDESDVLEVKSVTNEYELLSNHIFKEMNVGLLHGRLKQEEKDQIMNDFNDNKISILVSTSVIEVGIDVPNATIMIIEGAERFGLSQLHQFRGRVGRGEYQSYCFLFTNKLTQDGLKRLKGMEKYSSGFKLAEIDLEVRGPGEIYGVRQSGLPDLRMASLTDTETIAKARRQAEKILEKDPKFQNSEKLIEKLQEITEVFVND
ncbi:ATP-dependent DNA helicase RecG [Candidatus Peregrinibacteria bacterium]|jgi:ATP-dependent DNA helicase RecG|nr:ATP-dependent DNA helicase RecG [Candidatus Peregrinibacteria bacterium]